MKIRQLIASRSFAGSEQSTLTLCLGLQERGHDVAAGVRGDELRAIYEQHGVRVIDEPIDKWNDAFALARHVKREGVDLLHTHLTGATNIGFTASILTGRPVVAHARIFKKNLNYWLAARRGCLIANSHATADFYARGWPLHVPRKRIEVVWNSTRMHLDPAASQSKQALRADVIAELGLPSDARLVVLVGRFVEQKGQETLIEAWPRITAESGDERPVHALIIGRHDEDPQRVAAARERIAALGIAGSVHIVGPRSDVARLVRAAEVAVVPSRWEPFGLTVIEAMVMETPVVASNVPGMREIFLYDDVAAAERPDDDETYGLRIPVDDHDALADQVGRLLREPDFAGRIAAAAKAHALAMFTPDAMLDRIEAIYEKVLARRKRGGSR